MTKKICEKTSTYSTPKKSYSKITRTYERFFAYCCTHISKTNYWQKRGLSKEIVKKANLGFHPKFQVNKEGDTWPALIIPIDKHHFVARNTEIQSGKNDRFHASSGERVLYTTFSDVKNSPYPTWIVEGEIDALSLASVGCEAIAIGSTQNVPKLLKFLSENKPKAPLVLFLDSDATGRRAQEDLADRLKEMNIAYTTSNAEYKDANEFLLDDKERFRQFVRNKTLSIRLAQKYER